MNEGAGVDPSEPGDPVPEEAAGGATRLEQQEHSAAAEQPTDEIHAQAEEQPQPGPGLGELDDDTMDVSPKLGIDENLRSALGNMRGEADRIAALGTGQEQVEAAERFAEEAGRLDEQVGSAARAADDERR